jgi:hypothetical protein
MPCSFWGGPHIPGVVHVPYLPPRIGPSPVSASPSLYPRRPHVTAIIVATSPGPLRHMLQSSLEPHTLLAEPPYYPSPCRASDRTHPHFSPLVPLSFSKELPAPPL